MSSATLSTNPQESSPAGLLSAAVRDDFPILSEPIHDNTRLVYLDSAASSLRPRQVLEEMRRFEEREYANVHRGIHALSEAATDRFESARATVQSFLGAAHVEEIIFTSGTTAAINLVAKSWGEQNLREGDEILLTEMEHHANLVPWQQLAERRGVVLRHIPITDEGLLELDSLNALLTERTKLVALAHASNVLGTVNPVAEIARRAHAVGALVVVDAAQSVPHQPVDVQALGADFLAFSGHKMVGPSGVGVLYGGRELLDAMPPFLGGGGMINEVYLDRFTPAALPAKFEAGTPPIVGAVGLASAINYLDRVGLEAIHRHEQELVRRAHQAVSAIEGVRILGPRAEQRAGTLSFVLERIHAHDVAQILDRHGVAVRPGHHCTMPLHARLGISASSRASFYLYNQPEDIDVLVEGIVAAKKMFGSGRQRHRKRQG